MSGQHAILPISASKEWGHCGGWYALNKDIESQDTDESRWGNDAHDLAAPWLERASRGDPSPPKCDDKEMFETVEMYVRHCHELMLKTHVFGGPSLGIEARLTTDIHPEVWGTTDFYLYHAEKKTLYVRDFKSGHLLIEPDDDQVLGYANGAMQKLGLSDLDTVLDLGVVQPRGYHPAGPIRNVRMWAHELRVEFNRLRNRASENISGNGKAEAGPHCYNCNARFRCQAAIETGQSALYAVAEAIPVELQPAELGTLLRNTRRAIKYLEQMEKAYAGEVEGLLGRGVTVPGWHKEASFARSKEWTVPEEQVLMLGQLYGANLSKPGLITPTQAEKLIPKEIISGYCTRPQTGVKLVESKDNVANIFKESI